MLAKYIKKSYALRTSSNLQEKKEKCHEMHIKSTILLIFLYSDDKYTLITHY